MYNYLDYYKNMEDPYKNKVLSEEKLRSIEDSINKGDWQTYKKEVENSWELWKLCRYKEIGIEVDRYLKSCPESTQLIITGQYQVLKEKYPNHYNTIIGPHIRAADSRYNLDFCMSLFTGWCVEQFFKDLMEDFYYSIGINSRIKFMGIDQNRDFLTKVKKNDINADFLFGNNTLVELVSNLSKKGTDVNESVEKKEVFLRGNKFYRCKDNNVFIIRIVFGSSIKDSIFTIVDLKFNNNYEENYVRYGKKGTLVHLDEDKYTYYPLTGFDVQKELAKAIRKNKGISI